MARGQDSGAHPNRQVPKERFVSPFRVGDKVTGRLHMGMDGQIVSIIPGGDIVVQRGPESEEKIQGHHSYWASKEG